MTSGFKKVTLHSGKERSLLLRHPWVFSGAVRKTDSGISEGETVEVLGANGEYLATGHYHEGSIKVRVFAFERNDSGKEFWKNKFMAALALRKRLGLGTTATDAYRLIHGEGDGFPGLIIDIYGAAAVLQAHTLGMHSLRHTFAEILLQLFDGVIDTVYDKSSESLGRQQSLGSINSFLKGDRAETVVSESGIRFAVNYVEGQKTGFFLDQRENRLLLRQHSRDKSVLNTFCYSGGFSLAALAGGAGHVVSVDSSAKATALAERNTELNGFGSHEILTADVFEFLKKDTRLYDTVILDPPAFAKHLSSVDKAVVGYRNLNVQGFRKVKSGGLLFTFSCSQVIDKALFRKVVFQAAAQSGRNVRILHQLTQGPDHPISIYHPEGEYLKGLVLYVD
ncbi:MAG: hypothetical protein RL021_1677 [Bacteroidota bacterium]